MLETVENEKPKLSLGYVSEHDHFITTHSQCSKRYIYIKLSAENS